MCDSYLPMSSQCDARQAFPSPGVIGCVKYTYTPRPYSPYFCKIYYKKQTCMKRCDHLYMILFCKIVQNGH